MRRRDGAFLSIRDSHSSRLFFCIDPLGFSIGERFYYTLEGFTSHSQVAEWLQPRAILPRANGLLHP